MHAYSSHLVSVFAFERNLKMTTPFKIRCAVIKKLSAHMLIEVLLCDYNTPQDLQLFHWLQSMHRSINWQKCSALEWTLARWSSFYTWWCTLKLLRVSIFMSVQFTSLRIFYTRFSRWTFATKMQSNDHCSMSTLTKNDSITFVENNCVVDNVPFPFYLI